MTQKLMTPQSISISSIPSDGRTQPNSILDEIETDYNIAIEVLGEIKKQERAIENDIKMSQLMEERNNINSIPNQIMNPRQTEDEIRRQSDELIKNQHNSKIPATIMAQQPEVVEEERVLKDIQENFDKMNENMNSYNEIDEDDLLEDSQGFISKILDKLNIFSGIEFNIGNILYSIGIITIVFYLFNLIEIGLIITATLTNFLKINLLGYRNIISALSFGIIYHLIEKMI